MYRTVSLSRAVTTFFTESPDMRWRHFINAIAGLAAFWPLTAWAQQSLPVIGFLSSTSPDEYTVRLRTFRQGLQETGYVEGQNVAIEYRWAEDQNNRLPILAAELVQRQVTVIVAAGGTPSAAAAKAATANIPIIFAVAVDPVEAGFVASLSHSGGNLTGVTNWNVEVGPKRLEVLHQLLPTATTIAVLVDPTSPTLSEAFLRGLKTAVPTFGLQLYVLQASTEPDIDRVFAWTNDDQVRSSSAPAHSSIPGANSLPRYHSATRCRQSTNFARSWRLAAS
jgi:putative tryptophan/tyrosine transport system substrate-binding protein